MTVNELLNRIERECTGIASNEAVLSWLNTVEQAVYREIIATHEGWDLFPARRELNESDGETELIVPNDFCELYIRYITMKSRLKNHDITGYNNEAALFAAAYQDYSNYYNRTHLPLKRVSRFNA